MIACSHRWEVLLYFNDIYALLQESVRCGSCLLPSGSVAAKCVDGLSFLPGVLWRMKGGSQKKVLCAARCEDCGALGSRLGVGGVCEIVACETRHKIPSACGGICISLPVSLCPCVNGRSCFPDGV